MSATDETGAARLREESLLRQALEEVVSLRLGGSVTRLQRLSGGASQETWSFDVVAEGETDQGLILRRAPGAGRGSQAMTPEREARLQNAVYRAGVPVARVLFELDPDDGLGSGYVMERIAGETIARRILREERFARARGEMGAQCGRILARIHATPHEDLPELELVTGPAQVARYRQLYEGFDEPRPVFDLAFAALDGRLGEPRRVALVHGDFRNGNFIVGEEGIRAVLDWELAHLGDPYEDLSWLCVNSWRFGEVERRVGGFADGEELFRAYEDEAGVELDRELLDLWEVFGTLKWGVMCMLQGFAHLQGSTRSVEKAAIGRRVSETEVDLMRLLAPHAPRPEPFAGQGGGSDAPWGRGERPSLVDLTEAVREFVAEDVRGRLEGRPRFHALVAANVLGTIERELRWGPALEALEQEGLLALLADGKASPEASVRELNRELGRRLRSGALAWDDERVLAHLTAVAEAKIRIDNERYRPAPIR